MDHPQLPELPFGWSTPEVFVDQVHLGPLSICLAGIAAQHETGRTATGSAAALDEAPLARAGFELCERVAILECVLSDIDAIPTRNRSGVPLGVVTRQRVFPAAPAEASWRYAMSNGVALYSEWERACDSALLEAVERDAVLRSWLGGSRPRALPVPRSPFTEAIADFYELHFAEFSACEATVCGAFGFPKRAEVPLLTSFGAGPNLQTAWLRCETEALQRVGFLWGEEIPSAKPALTGDAMSQQEYYLWPESHRYLRSWLSGKYEQRPTPARRQHRGLPFADLTPHAFRERLFVAKALDPECTPLVFGEGHPHTLKRPSASLRVQPIA